jgi:hypothetical protein
LALCITKAHKLNTLVISAKEILRAAKSKGEQELFNLSNIKKLVLNENASSQSTGDWNEVIKTGQNLQSLRMMGREKLGKRDLRKRIKLIGEIKDLEELTMNLEIKKADGDQVLELIRKVMEGKIRRATLQFLGYRIDKEMKDQIEVLMRMDMYKKVMIGFHNAMITKEPYTRKCIIEELY